MFRVEDARVSDRHLSLAARTPALAAETASQIGVMHLTDTLGAGGAERVAVNIVNLLPREHYTPYLCTTRNDGPLASLIGEDVGRLQLARRGRFDMRALKKLISFIREHEIKILHAHQTSLFVAALASLFPPYPKVVWHDHYGRLDLGSRPAWAYRQAARRVGGVIAVSRALSEWSEQLLGIPRDRIWYIRNFITENASGDERVELPGERGNRIVCVANFRPQKDHHNLLQAMKLIVARKPSARLFMIGVPVDAAYVESIERAIVEHGLSAHVTMLGERSDVTAILRECDIGVLSSGSEGLPLALIEYGMVGLPAVATNVGQCAEVLDGGRVGMLVPPAAPERLAEQIVSLLDSPDLRRNLGEAFRRRVREVYSPDAALSEVCQVYETVLKTKPRLD